MRMACKAGGVVSVEADEAQANEQKHIIAWEINQDYCADTCGSATQVLGRNYPWSSKTAADSFAVFKRPWDALLTCH
jgi:hypothetical protein